MLTSVDFGSRSQTVYLEVHVLAAGQRSVGAAVALGLYADVNQALDVQINGFTAASGVRDDEFKDVLQLVLLMQRREG